jgi:DNA polymerase-3 subunit alpha
VLAIAMVCTNQEYITNRGGDEKTLCRFAWSIINIQEIIDKVEIYSLYRDVLLPKYDIPEEFINPEMRLIME